MLTSLRLLLVSSQNSTNANSTSPTQLPTLIPSAQPSTILNATALPSASPSLQLSSNTSVQPSTISNATALPSASPSLQLNSNTSTQPSTISNSTAPPSASPSLQLNSNTSAQPSTSPNSNTSSSPSFTPSSAAPTTASPTVFVAQSAIDPNAASYPVNPSQGYVWGKVPQSCTCEENGATPSDCAYFQCTCTCDLHAGNCDYGCCCDPDCSEAQVRLFTVTEALMQTRSLASSCLAVLRMGPRGQSSYAIPPTSSPK